MLIEDEKTIDELEEDDIIDEITTYASQGHTMRSIVMIPVIVITLVILFLALTQI